MTTHPTDDDLDLNIRSINTAGAGDIRVFNALTILRDRLRVIESKITTKQAEQAGSEHEMRCTMCGWVRPKAPVRPLAFDLVAMRAAAEAEAEDHQHDSHPCSGANVLKLLDAHGKLAADAERRACERDDWRTAAERANAKLKVVEAERDILYIALARNRGEFPELTAAEKKAARGGRTFLLIGMDHLAWSRMSNENKIETLQRGLGARKDFDSSATDFDIIATEMDLFCTLQGIRQKQ